MCYDDVNWCDLGQDKAPVAVFNDGMTNRHLSSSSFLGSTAQLRSWPPRLNFLEASQHFLFYRVGLLAPTPNSHPG
jgi:hypothetical protein